MRDEDDRLLASRLQLAVAPRLHRPPEEPSRVILLDDDEDVLEALAGLLEYLTGAPSLKLRSFRELIHSRVPALSCQLAILDVNLGAGQPSGVDAFRWLEGERFGGRVVFLTGHGHDHPLVREASALHRAVVMRKPIGIAELRQLVDETGAHAS